MKALRVLSVLLILTITPAFLFAQASAEKKKLKCGVKRSHSLIWLPALDLNQGSAGLTEKSVV